MLLYVRLLLLYLIVISLYICLELDPDPLSKRITNLTEAESQVLTEIHVSQKIIDHVRLVVDEQEHQLIEEYMLLIFHMIVNGQQ